MPGAGCGPAVFPNSQLVNCPDFGADIKACQLRGKAVLLSLDPGRGTDADWYASEDAARAYAEQIWVSFLGGSSDTRPYGDAIFDGLRVETPRTGDLTGYWAFFDQLRKLSLASPSDKPYFLIAAVWCFSLDFLRDVLTSSPLDALFVWVLQQDCSVAHYDDKAQWNYGDWDAWASSSGVVDRNIRLYF
ncbi:hypothetical protein EXIGLDRAFT_607558, partial [Exidia glandulosa HHB12029]